MNSEPYLITSYSPTKGTEIYFATLPKNAESLTFQAETFCGNLDRFLPLMQFAKSGKMRMDCWWIWTDTHDVLFQGELPELPEVPKGPEILVAPEGRTFYDIEFWRDKTPSTLMFEQVYNVGCFAMTGRMFKEFLTYLEARIEEYKDFSSEVYLPVFGETVAQKHLEILLNQFGDTILFNEFIQMHDFSPYPHLFTCLAFDLDMGKTVRKNGQYTDQDGIPYHIVHLNGDTRNADSRYPNRK